jgi:hypothetical protein
LLARNSLLGTILPVDKKAIAGTPRNPPRMCAQPSDGRASARGAAGTVLQNEYDELMRALNNRQARKVNLLPLTAAVRYATGNL